MWILICLWISIFSVFFFILFTESARTLCNVHARARLIRPFTGWKLKAWSSNVNFIKFQCLHISIQRHFHICLFVMLRNPRPSAPVFPSCTNKVVFPFKGGLCYLDVKELSPERSLEHLFRCLDMYLHLSKIESWLSAPCIVKSRKRVIRCTHVFNILYLPSITNTCNSLYLLTHENCQSFCSFFYFHYFIDFFFHSFLGA